MLVGLFVDKLQLFEYKLKKKEKMSSHRANEKAEMPSDFASRNIYLDSLTPDDCLEWHYVSHLRTELTVAPTDLLFWSAEGGERKKKRPQKFVK